jgi:hypothetical protein
MPKVGNLDLETIRWKSGDREGLRCRLPSSIECGGSTQGSCH